MHGAEYTDSSHVQAAQLDPVYPVCSAGNLSERGGAVDKPPSTVSRCPIPGIEPGVQGRAIGIGVTMLLHFDIASPRKMRS